MFWYIIINIPMDDYYKLSFFFFFTKEMSRANFNKINSCHSFYYYFIFFFFLLKKIYHNNKK